jgi:hypothetical protein
MKPTWTEERAELAIWLRSYTETIARWIKKFLEDPEHPVSKTKMLGQLDEWITGLSEYRDQIMLMRSDPTGTGQERRTVQTRRDEYHPDDVIPDLFTDPNYQGETPDEE